MEFFRDRFVIVVLVLTVLFNFFYFTVSPVFKLRYTILIPLLVLLSKWFYDHFMNSRRYTCPQLINQDMNTSVVDMPEWKYVEFFESGFFFFHLDPVPVSSSSSGTVMIPEDAVYFSGVNYFSDSITYPFPVNLLPSSVFDFLSGSGYNLDNLYMFVPKPGELEKFTFEQFRILLANIKTQENLFSIVKGDLTNLKDVLSELDIMRETLNDKPKESWFKRMFSTKNKEVEE